MSKNINTVQVDVDMYNVIIEQARRYRKMTEQENNPTEINPYLRQAFKDSQDQVRYLEELLLQFVPTPERAYPTEIDFDIWTFRDHEEDTISTVPPEIIKEAYNYFRRKLGLDEFTEN